MQKQAAVIISIGDVIQNEMIIVGSLSENIADETIRPHFNQAFDEVIPS